MKSRTQLEDVSNEIYFEIFDHLHALHIFTAFTALNHRISVVLYSIPLHVVISEDHFRCQVEYLSSHLTSHAHQVISLQVDNTIRDRSSIISFLFDRHHFANLRSCKFYGIEQSTELTNVITQLRSLNRLVSFAIYQRYDGILNENDIIRTMLMHKSSPLRSIHLRIPHDYSDISHYSCICSTITSLSLYIYGSPSTVSVDSVIPILRLCHSVLRLGIALLHTDIIGPRLRNTFNQVPSVDVNDLPKVSQLRSFHLTILARCKRASIARILCCILNLKNFYFHLKILRASWRFPRKLLDGRTWRDMFDLYVPCLTNFEYHIAVVKQTPILSLHDVINSFEYFVEKYADWHMIIDTYNVEDRCEAECIILRTLNYHKVKSSFGVRISPVISETFETLSTTTDGHHVFYPDLKRLELRLSTDALTITWSSPLYPHVKNLKVSMLRRSSIWSRLSSVVNLHETSDDDAQETVTHLSLFLELSNIIRLELAKFDALQWKHVQFIIEACPRLNKLSIDICLLVLPKLIDNPSLISIFKQIESIQLRTSSIYFPPSFASKLARQFPSLMDIQLKVFSFDHCPYVIETFLAQLENLFHLNIHYHQDTLLDDPFSREYVIRNRRESFPNRVLDEKCVDVRNTGEKIQIWLS